MAGQPGFSMVVRGHAEIAARMRALGAEMVKPATRGLNRWASSQRAAATRALAQDTKQKASVVRPRVELKKANYSNLEAGIRISGRRIPVIEFGARQTRRGVTYQLGRGRGLIPGGFIATMRSGHRGVFVRIDPSRTRRGLPPHAPGLPIREAKGPSLPEAMRNLMPAFLPPARASLTTIMERELSFYLSQRSGGSGGSGGD